jgi:high-affinity Fe2+/Pb2+ permease
MKQKDIYTLFVLGLFSAIVAYFMSSTFLVKPVLKEQKAEVAEKITADFQTSKVKTYITEQSINFTKPVTIGDQSPNATPFDR